MTAKKKATKADDTKERTVFLDFDIADLEAQPKDGDRCKTKVFNPGKGQQQDGPMCIFDQRRGVFFREPTRDDTGMVTSCETGQRRDNYKAERVRNVVAFYVLEAGVDPGPEPGSIIDHRNALAHASSRPAQHHLPGEDSGPLPELRVKED